MKRILLAGATGYLGGYIVTELGHRGFPVRAIVRKGSPLKAEGVESIDFVEAELTKPETLTHKEIARIAYSVLGTKVKVTCIPDWIRAAILRLIRWTTTSKTYGPIEFFLTVMAMDMVAPEYGSHTLRGHFADLREGTAHIR